MIELNKDNTRIKSEGSKYFLRYVNCSADYNGDVRIILEKGH